MKSLTLSALGLAVILSACAQKEEPPIIMSEPVYDKMGNLVSPSVPVSGMVMVDTNGDGVADTAVASDPAVDDPDLGNSPNRNTTRNMIQNRNRG